MFKVSRVSRSLDNVIPTKLGFTEWQEGSEKFRGTLLACAERKVLPRLGAGRRRWKRAKWRKRGIFRETRVGSCILPSMFPLSFVPARCFPVVRPRSSCRFAIEFEIYSILPLPPRALVSMILFRGTTPN